MFQGVKFVDTWYHAQWNNTCSVKCLCVCYASCTICTFDEALFWAVARIRAIFSTDAIHFWTKK